MGLARSASSDTLSRCDVVLSLDASVLALFISLFSLLHTLTHTLSSMQNNPKTHFDTLCRLTYYPSVQNGGHQFNPPPRPLHIPPPPVCFVLHVPFPLRIPVIPLVTVVIVMHPCLKSCQRTSCLSHTRTQAHSCTHMNDKTQINKLMNTLTRPTSPSLIHTYSCNILACLSTCLSVCLEEVRCVISVLWRFCHKPTAVIKQTGCVSTLRSNTGKYTHSNPKLSFPFSIHMC